MAKVKSLQSSEESKAKKEAEDLRFKFAKTDTQKKFLKDNPNVKTASEMDKKIASKKSAMQSQSRMNLRKGGSVKKKKSSGAAIRGKGCEIR